MHKKKFNFYTKIKTWLKRDTPLFATRISFIASLLIAIFGIAIGISEGSLAVKINGLIASVDVLNSLLLITAVNHSIKSPDYVFNYGYGKYESISILVSAGLFFIVSGYTLYEAIQSFGDIEEINGNYYYLLIFSTISFLLMNFMSKFEKKTAKKFHIPILEYDSNIWKIDSYIELGIISNLILGAILSYNDLSYYGRIIDSLTAVLLMAYALKTPLKGSKDALNQLLDRTLSDQVQFEILSIVVQHLNQMCEYKTVHTRQSGKDIFIEIDLVLPFDYTMNQKNEIEEILKKSITAKFPTAITRIYAHPCSGECISGEQRNCPIFLN